MENKYLEISDPEKKPKEEDSEFWELLKNHPIDFWIVYVIELFIEFPFAIVLSSATIYNIDVQKFTEIEAGIIFAFIGLAVGVCAVAFSSFPARNGVKHALVYGNMLGLLANVLNYFFTNRYAQVLIMFVFYIPSLSLNFISLKLAIKQYSYTETRSFGYSLFYMIFFICAGVSAAIIDVLLTAYGIEKSVFSYLFIVNAICYAIALCISFFLREIDLEVSGETVIDKSQEKSQNSWQYTREVLVTKRFWRFFSLILLLSVVKSMFFHLTATLPQYMYRDLGKGAHFGYMMAGHQLVLIIATPTLTFLLFYFTPYSLLLIGSLISTSSVLVFLFGSNYYTIAIFVMIISLGEAIYSPRLVDYTLSVAPKGKEAVYIGIANVPNFLSLLITGISSGILLYTVCPAEGEKDCKIMWFWIGGYSLVACVVMISMKNLFEDQKINKEI